ncbi:hypothetical protein SLU01_26960 [Sporosarcina luteola]|uniref:5-formyltetrahydrofolate cyclo-ligase n=1 Tax=Sporosarcina luteola TaxID=582850 RepID=A0A511ZAB8_9BACL|nr:5-formyltetrahydrofolate cyclo-ligase [Sporosarcina luteola]GEN84384.1 hypothetical protein SLU01_26960 [Sporosarcina luteola]
MSKLSLRNETLTMMKSMKRADHANQSAAIMEQLIASKEYTTARTIGITISRFPEVDTRMLIETAWKSGKQIAVPKCIPSTREMDFRIITSFEDLETVYMDLLEPAIERTETIEKKQIDLQVVPGVVFSKEGYRIGFGGGYYDRYLTDFPGTCISLAFDIQTGKTVPIEEHDIPVDMIITENEVIQCRKIRDEK